MFVPVVDKYQNPLMPTTESRARRWITSGKATPFWKKGVFCVRLNVEPSARNMQPIAVAVDPGSKKEGMNVKSKSHVYLNIQLDAINHVSDSVKTRREMRRNRRSRKTPCRKPKVVQGKRMPPSTFARWQWKLNWINRLRKIFPITDVIVEDINAKTKGKPKWDKSFSPLEVGKQWFYSQIPDVITKEGWETAELREELGIKKSSNKMSNDFYAHCGDCFALAYSVVGGREIDNKDVLCITQLRFHRRQLHKLNPSKGGKRMPYGGTMSMGFKRGNLVKHKKYGVCYVGGSSKGRISLHCFKTGKRLCQNALAEDCKFLSYNKIRCFVVQQ